MAGNSFNNILKPLLNKAIVLLFISCNLLFVYMNSSGFRELDKILNAGKLTIITHNNSHCYYLYREQAMGFEYELAKLFADYLGVALEVNITEKWDSMISA